VAGFDSDVANFTIFDLPFADSGKRIKFRNVFKAHIPIRAIRHKDVSVRSYCYGAIETPSGYLKKRPVHLKAGKCRTAFRTEAFLVPG
jgi:hypothetical protein